MKTQNYRILVLRMLTTITIVTQLISWDQINLQKTAKLEELASKERFYCQSEEINQAQQKLKVKIRKTV